MWTKELEAKFWQLAEEVFIGIAEWRVQHPKATFQEIEAVTDERLAKVRARILQDAALASVAADIGRLEERERPRCPECGEVMNANGQETRHLTTNYNQTISLKRTQVLCPKCGKRFFPPR